MKIQSKAKLCLTLGSCVFPALAWAVDIAIHFTGINKEIEANLRQSISILQEGAEEIGGDRERFEEEEIRVKHEIQLGLQPFGYYSPTIDSKLDTNTTPWQITYSIQLNEPVKISSVQTLLSGEGEHDPALQGLWDLFTLKPGAVFNHEIYEQGKKAVLTKVITAGFLDAMFTEHRVEVDPRLHSGQIFLVLATGKRHYFGQIDFSQSTLSPKFLQRYLGFSAGDVYAPEKILSLQSDLTQSDYFSQVTVKPIVTENDPTVPVKIELEDAKPNQYIIGAGYGTDTGIRGKLGWNRRQVNSWGHRVMAQAQVSEVYDKVEMNYIIPGKHPNTDQVRIKGGYFEEQYSDQPSTLYELGITEERNIETWKRRLSLTFLQEQYNAFSTNQGIAQNLLLPTITFIQTKRDDPTAPSNGRRIELTIRGAIDGLGSDTSFMQAYMQIRWLHAFNDTTRGLLRTEGGFTLPSDVENLPLSQRFFAGGDLSLRGYGYRMLPQEINKIGVREPPGGGYLGIVSAEISKTIKKPFGVFTFVDAGNAFRQLTVDQIEIGTGVGVECQTRLGPIKFAIAKPLTKPSDSWRIHATFGPEV